jgi:hypothetical protein
LYLYHHKFWQSVWDRSGVPANFVGSLATGLGNAYEIKVWCSLSLGQNLGPCNSTQDAQFFHDPLIPQPYSNYVLEMKNEMKKL